MVEQSPAVDAAAPARGFPLRPVLAASSATAIANLPAFLVGALAVRMHQELGFTTAGTGLAVSAFSAASALAGPVVGRAVQGWGTVRAFRAGATLTALTLIGIGGVARTYPLLVGLLVAGGLANAVNQTTANLALAQHGATGRDGLAFGTKQAAVPFSSMLAGFAVPVFVGALGWRWAFMFGAVLAVAVAAVAPRMVPNRPQPTPAASARPRHAAAGSAPVDWPLIVLIAAAAFFAAGTALSVAVFLVDFAVHIGASESWAGTLLALASVVVIAVRVLAGVWVDARTRRGLPRVALLQAAAMIAAGGLGLLLVIGASRWPVLLPFGIVLAMGMGWGWPGLIHFTVVSLNRGAAAVTTGVLLAGVFGGGVVVPALLGAVIERVSYTAGWTAATISLGAAVAGMLLANRRLQRGRSVR